MRGGESLAYDLIVWRGRVRGRVALLLRSTERKPPAGQILGQDFVEIFLQICPHLMLAIRKLEEGGKYLVEIFKINHHRVRLLFFLFFLFFFFPLKHRQQTTE